MIQVLIFFLLLVISWTGHNEYRHNGEYPRTVIVGRLLSRCAIPRLDAACRVRRHRRAGCAACQHVFLFFEDVCSLTRSMGAL